MPSSYCSCGFRNDWSGVKPLKCQSCKSPLTPKPVAKAAATPVDDQPRRPAQKLDRFAPDSRVGGRRADESDDAYAGRAPRGHDVEDDTDPFSLGFTMQIEGSEKAPTIGSIRQSEGAFERADSRVAGGSVPEIGKLPSLDSVRQEALKGMLPNS